MSGFPFRCPTPHVSLSTHIRREPSLLQCPLWRRGPHKLSVCSGRRAVGAALCRMSGSWTAWQGHLRLGRDQTSGSGGGRVPLFQSFKARLVLPMPRARSASRRDRRTEGLAVAPPPRFGQLGTSRSRESWSPGMRRRASPADDQSAASPRPDAERSSRRAGDSRALARSSANSDSDPAPCVSRSRAHEACFPCGSTKKMGALSHSMVLFTERF